MSEKETITIECPINGEESEITVEKFDRKVKGGGRSLKILNCSCSERGKKCIDESGILGPSHPVCSDLIVKNISLT